MKTATLGLIVALVFLSGCASTRLMENCERQGDSQYYHCNTVSLSK